MYNNMNSLVRVIAKKDYKTKQWNGSIDIKNKYLKYLYETYSPEFVILLSGTKTNPEIRITTEDDSFNEFMFFKSLLYLEDSKNGYNEVEMANINAIYPCYSTDQIYFMRRFGDYIYKIYDHKPMIDETDKYKNYIITHSEKSKIVKSRDENVRNVLKIIFNSIDVDRTILYTDIFTDDLLSTLNKNFLKQFFEIRDLSNHPMMNDYFRDKYI